MFPAETNLHHYKFKAGICYYNSTSDYANNFVHAMMQYHLKSINTLLDYWQLFALMCRSYIKSDRYYLMLLNSANYGYDIQHLDTS